MRMFSSCAWMAGFCLFILPSLAMSQVSLEPLGCGRVEKQPGGYGPFDYRLAKDKLPLVENFHFDSGVETFTKKKTGDFGHDIGYTLRAFPNHHRALMAMVNLGLKEKAKQPRGAPFTVDCFLMRAEHYQSDDGMVKVIYGIYYLKHGRSAEAAKKLEEAAVLTSDDANVSYNLGLAYYQLKDYEKALKAAHRAYALGFPLPGLRDMLKRAGKWEEPVVSPMPEDPVSEQAEEKTEPASP